MPGNWLNAAINEVIGSGREAIEEAANLCCVEALFGANYQAVWPNLDLIKRYVSPGKLKPAVTFPISAVEISLAWPRAWFAAVRIMSSRS